MIAYLDASVLAKLFLEEHGTEIAREVWESELPVATARISHTELACALGAAIRDARLNRGAVREGVVDGTFLWGRAVAVEANTRVVHIAARLGMRHKLGALDAVHVASVCSLRDLDPVLVSWDARQRQAAVAEGIPVYPEGNTAASR